MPLEGHSGTPTRTPEDVIVYAPTFIWWGVERLGMTLMVNAS
jgi:hypothetical protein